MTRQMDRLRRLCGQLVAVAPQPTQAEPNQASGQVDQDYQEAEFRRYCEEAEALYWSLPCRGPVKFGPDGLLDPEILERYYEYGFYVFEDMIPLKEVDEARQDLENLVDNAPKARKATVDKHGRPVRWPKIYAMQKPLADNVGGSTVGIYNFKGGETIPRHHIKMREPAVPAGAPELPEAILSNLADPMAHMDAALRIYGHPKILKIIESVNGPDFCPFSESVFYKPAFFGTPTAWHQDPSCAWDDESPNWSGAELGTCGVNTHVSLYPCNAVNALWIVPGSNRRGRLDQKSLLEPGSIDRIKGAVPILAKPGDYFIQNRYALHGAFPNTSPEPRAALEFGFQRKASVLYAGCTVKNAYARGHAGKEKIIYDEDYIFRRSAMIQVAIDCRRQKYPEETPYSFAPFRGKEDDYRWSPELKEEEFKTYFQDPLFL